MSANQTTIPLSSLLNSLLAQPATDNPFNDPGYAVNRDPFWGYGDFNQGVSPLAQLMARQRPGVSSVPPLLGRDSTASS